MCFIKFSNQNHSILILYLYIIYTYIVYTNLYTMGLSFFIFLQNPILTIANDSIPLELLIHTTWFIPRGI